MTISISMNGISTTLRRAGWRLLLGGGIYITLFIVALLAPQLAPHAADTQHLEQTLLPPFWMDGGHTDYLLGTDVLGRDILSQLIYGARVTAIVVVLAPLGAALTGSCLGLMAGYLRGWTEKVIMTLVEIWMAFPSVVLAMLLMVALMPGFTSVILAIILVDWTRFCRVIRGEVITWRDRDFVKAARLSGASHLSVMVSDLLPVVRPTLMVLITLEMATAIMAESILSFVGMSVGPDTPSWGAMIARSLNTVFSAPWQLVPPMAAIVITIFAAMMLGTGLRFSRREQTATGDEVLV
tara:strand:+ start:49272 stop:50159 length:888 start_codon:yes stop_codon:yes gene_type:complete